MKNLKYLVSALLLVTMFSCSFNEEVIIKQEDESDELSVVSSSTDDKEIEREKPKVED
ncbi:MAG: hypothetical protein WBA74_25400 [Cyclobacteriaceae bacterium]